jgi:hypothetical protein
MNRQANPIPDGFRTATPHLCITGAAGAGQRPCASRNAFTLS